jgi:hypothetical protein
LLFYEFPHAMSVCVPFNNKFEHLDYKKWLFFNKYVKTPIQL